MSRKSPLESAAPADFFVLRAPLLPFSTLVDWGASLEARGAVDAELEDALSRDRARLLSALKDIARRPEVREAVFCASPTLDEAVDAWLTDTTERRAEGVTNILVRYVSRMAGRATPFGLFSRCGVGRIEPGSTRIRVVAREEISRHTRLDMQYLTALVQALERRDDVRESLRFVPSTGLYRLGGQIHYVEASYEGDKIARSFKLVSVEASDVLDCALSAAGQGAFPQEIARAIARADASISVGTAAEFVSELIDSQLLVSELAPPITGPEPIHHVIRRLRERGIASDVSAKLEHVRDLLAEIDARGVGQPVDGYRAVASVLTDLPAKIDPARLFQVDLAQGECGARLGPAVLREIERGVSLLERIATPTPAPDLDAFRNAFRARYEAAEVPLMVALDEELGVGFGSTSNIPSPLIDALPFRAKERTDSELSPARRALLLARALEHARGESSSWELGERDLESLASEPAAELPDSFFANLTVAASSAEALERGDFKVWLQHAALGGARMFGRFCHADPTLLEAVTEHLRAEERLAPDAIFAEIVHLPEGRTGNILCRPVLREHEIPFMASPGVDAAHAIGLDDLLVSVEGSGVHLRSKRLGRRVLPRMTNAHNPQSTSLSVYRFLCALSEAARHSFSWSWGDLWAAPRLPRVTHGKLVLALARWRLPAIEVDALRKASGAARYRATKELRRRHDLPRFIAAHGGGDNFVPVDFDNALSADNWVDMLKAGEDASVSELFPAPDDLVASASDGTYVCEIVVPFITTRPPTPEPLLPPLPTLKRSFLPGSEWLFVKIYSGPVTAEAVLREVVTPVVLGARKAGADRWFFIRYSDTGNHIRLRFQGPASVLLEVILPELRDRIGPWIDSGRVHRFAVDTYDRELERYGGDHGMELCEQVFCEDSEAVLAALAAGDAEAEPDTRWRLTLLGMDMFLGDLGLDLDAKVATMRAIRDSFAREHAVDTAFERELGNRFRTNRAQIEALLEGKLGEELAGLAEGVAALAARTERLAPTMRELRSRAERGLLGVPISSLAWSLLHMHANRMLVADHRAQELVLYDFLLRTYESRAARKRRGK